MRKLDPMPTQNPRNDFAGRSRDIQRPPIADINDLAAERAAQGHALTNLGQAVLGLPPPEAAMDQVRRYLEVGGVQGYSPDPGLAEVREGVAAFCRDHKEIDAARADQVMLTCGANQAFVNTMLTLTRPGDEVITFGPGYFDHDLAIRLASCVNVEVGLVRTDNRFRFDIDAVADALTPRTRVVVLVSPGNPTGAVIDDASLEQLTDLCAQRGLWLVSDETYDLLTFPGAHHRSPATLARDHVVVIGSFSKVFGLAGWRIGYLLGPAWLVDEAIKAQDSVVVCAPVPAQLAALGALGQVDDFARKARAVLLERRDTLLSILGDLAWLTPTVPEGATFTLANLGEGADDVALCRDLVIRAGVVTVPGSAFGPRGAGWVRFSFGNLPVDQLREAGARLRQFDPKF
jgi:aspartate/methionine/tyrosine aminotransferase